MILRPMIRFFNFSIFSLFRVSLFAGIVLFWPIHGHAGQRFHYAGLLGGVQVLDAYVTMDLPSGGEGNYRIEMEAVTFGSLASLYPYRAQAETTGSIHQGKVIPKKFSSHAKALDNEAGVTLEYNRDGTIKRAPLSAKGTIDPLSALLATMMGDGGYCEGRLAVYDGAARYDLLLSSGGENIFIAPLKVGPFTVASVQQCLANIQIASGADPNLEKFGLIPKTLRVGRNEGTEPSFIPLENAVILGIGEIEIKLVE